MVIIITYDPRTTPQHYRIPPGNTDAWSPSVAIKSNSALEQGFKLICVKLKILADVTESVMTTHLGHPCS